jgi:hypothetical protein
MVPLARTLTLGSVLFLLACTSFFTGEETSDGEPSAEDVALQLERDIKVQGSYRITFDSQFGFQRLYTTIVATNVGDRALVAWGGSHLWWLRAYRTPERDGSPIWTMDDALAASGSIDVLDRVQIPAGDTVIFGEGRFPPFPVPSILGSNPPGTYYFTVELRLSEPRVSHVFAAGQVELPGGASR